MEAIAYLRSQQGLAPIDLETLRNEDQANWPDRIAQLQQVPFGARFVQEGGTLVIDPSGDDTDIAASAEPLTGQLHDGIRQQAQKFAVIAKRVDNLPGWTGLAEAADRFSRTVDCSTNEIPPRIGTVYEVTVTLASFLDLDARIRKAPTLTDLDPLPFEVHRAFANLIQNAAPWVRRFPSARMLDDEAGAFLARPDLYEPAAVIVEVAAATRIISAEDAHLLQMLSGAAARGEFQGQKAGARSIWSSKNLVTAVATAVLSFQAGLINNKAAEQSLIAQRGAQLYVRAEREVLKLFEDAPADIRQALAAMIDELKKSSGSIPGNLPEPPRIQPVNQRRRNEKD